MIAPAGSSTRPTADRVRQALFDTLMHAEWGGRGAIEGAVVLDVFAGTGALGLEALSRGAASACFIESDAGALRALRANVAACGADRRVEILAGDVFRIAAASAFGDRRSPASERRQEVADMSAPRRVSDTTVSALPGSGLGPATLVFLDPPYGLDLIPPAIARLRQVGRLVDGALTIAETARNETWVPNEPLLAERHHGAARVLIFRTSSTTFAATSVRSN